MNAKGVEGNKLWSS